MRMRARQEICSPFTMYALCFDAQEGGITTAVGPNECPENKNEPGELGVAISS